MTKKGKKWMKFRREHASQWLLKPMLFFKKTPETCVPVALPAVYPKIPSLRVGVVSPASFSMMTEDRGVNMNPAISGTCKA